MVKYTPARVSNGSTVPFSIWGLFPYDGDIHLMGNALAEGRTNVQVEDDAAVVVPHCIHGGMCGLRLSSSCWVGFAWRDPGRVVAMRHMSSRNKSSGGTYMVGLLTYSTFSLDAAAGVEGGPRCDGCLHASWLWALDSVSMHCVALWVAEDVE